MEELRYIADRATPVASRVLIVYQQCLVANDVVKMVEFEVACHV